MSESTKSGVLLPHHLPENLFVEMAHQALTKYIQESTRTVSEREHGMFLIGWATGAVDTLGWARNEIEREIERREAST